MPFFFFNAGRGGYPPNGFYLAPINRVFVTILDTEYGGKGWLLGNDGAMAIGICEHFFAF